MPGREAGSLKATGGPDEPGSRPDTGEWRALREECVWTARRLGATEGDVEDLAQETLTRLYVVLPTVGSRRAWVLRVLRNLLYDQRKRRATRARTHSRAAWESSEVTSPSGAWRAVADVTRILPRLPPKSRRLLELYRRGYTHREIATHLGCEIHQVGPRIHSALETAKRRATRSPGRAPRP